MVTQAEARDAAMRLRMFTVGGLAFACNTNTREALELIRKLEHKGTVICLGPLKMGKRGRPPVVYAFADPKIFGMQSVSHSRPRETPPELAVAAQARSRRQRQTTSGRRKKKRGMDKDTEKLLKAVESQPGFSVEHGPGHSKIVAPDGQKIAVAGTTSDHRSIKNLKAQVRRKGGDV